MGNMISIIKTIIYSICIGNTIFMIGGIFFAGQEVQKMIISVMIMSLLMGMCTFIYRAKKLPLLAQTLFHICGSYVVFLITAYVNKWFPFHVGAIVVASIIFLAIFMLIWFVFYQREKRVVASVNQHLSKL